MINEWGGTEVQTQSNVENINLLIEKEIKNYIQEPKEPQMTNIFQFWKDLGQIKYPQMSCSSTSSNISHASE